MNSDAIVGMSFAEWLAGLGEQELAGLLAARPDAMAAPQPLTLGELAERLSLPHGVQTMLADVHLPSFQTLEAIAALGDGTARLDVEALLDGSGEGVRPVLDGLVGRGLVWPDGERLHLVEPLRDWPIGDGPLGLGPPVAVLVSRLTVDMLRRIASELGLPVSGRRKNDLRAQVEGALRDGDRIRGLVAAAPQRARILLEKAALHGRVEGYQHIFGLSARNNDPYGWALARGILIQLDWQSPLMPAEVALALRGDTYHAPFDPVAPVPATLPAPREAVAVEFAAIAARAVEEATEIVRLCAKAPPARRKSGGVGVRELRRAAKATGSDEDAASLWLELAASAELVAWSGDELVPTAGCEAWQAGEPAERLASLLWIWRQMPRLPLLVDPDATRSAPLDQRAHDQAAPRLRAVVLETLAALPTELGAAGPAALTAAVMWRRPTMFEDAELAPRYLTAVWREAELLGVLAHGALTPAGRALASGSHAAVLAEVAATALPSACTTVVFQADLTAVVPGPPSAWLTDLLDSVADRESRGSASVWRFGPASVRRALDGGQTADELLSALRAATGRELPQPVEYLIGDVARRHGEVIVIPVACVISCPRPGLLAEVRTHRGLASLGLRELAPTVLAAAKPVTETLKALRRAGYVPVRHDDNGVPIIERVPQRQTETTPKRLPATSRPVKPTGRPAPQHNPAELAERLLGTPSTSTGEPDSLADLAPQLSAAELRMLSHARHTGAAIRIGYVNGDGNPSTRIIESLELTGQHLTAWCRLRNAERVFHLKRITAVTPA